jgi:hypothetical protein
MEAARNLYIVSCLMVKKSELLVPSLWIAFGDRPWTWALVLCRNNRKHDKFRKFCFLLYNFNILGIVRVELMHRNGSIGCRIIHVGLQSFLLADKSICRKAGLTGISGNFLLIFRVM